MRIPFLSALLPILVIIGVTAHASHAMPDPTERLEPTPTAWWWLYGVSASEISDLIATTDARLIDLEVQSTDPLLFSAAFVPNAGVHRVNGWWWYFGIPFEDIGNYVDENQARLIDIERYGDGLFAVIMVDNTGPDAKSWWYYGGRTLAQMDAVIEANDARLVDIESFSGAGTTLYDAIMIANTRQDASGWYWWLNVSESFISEHINRTGYRIVDLDVVGTSDGTRFNVITMPPQSKWWWYYGKTAAQVTALYEQTGSRIVDIERYSLGGSTYFAVALTDNSNELTSSLATELGYGNDGSTGFYLREVGGPTLASLQPDFRFEPASTIKIFHHFHAWRMIATGVDQTNSLLSYSENYNNSCPIGGSPIVARTLYDTLQLMMWNSDNAATEGIRARYGEPAIMSSVRIFGGVSTDSDLNHAPLGCGTPAVANPNELTLRDAGELYEEIATGPFLSTVRTGVYETMQSHLTPEGNQWWLTDQVQQMVVDEATALGIPGDAGEFWNEMEIAWKPGGYELNGRNFTSVAGTIQIPDCTSGSSVDRDYVFGMFIHDSLDTQRLFDLTQELFRELIHEGLESCLVPTSAPEATIARALTLENATPNPFNPSTMIRFALADPGLARVEVIDTRGRVVATLIDGFREAGEHQVLWDGRDDSGAAAATGVYFVKAQAADEVQTRKMTLLK